MGPNLKKYIKQQNSVIEFFKWSGMKLYDPNNLSEEDKTKLAMRLASDLSPEVMTCDGEIRGAKLQAKMRFMANVKKEFEELGVQIPAY